MGIDARLKRFFPLILCLLIGMAAYFQATAMSQLLASTMSGGDASPAAFSVPFPSPSEVKLRSGGAILARNPFDSVTGPLDGVPQPDPEPSDELASEGDGEPGSDEDPTCGFGKVVLISASPDPGWSFAAIQEGGGSAQLRRVGDEVSGHTVQAMGWDTVWLSSGQTRCRLKLGDRGQPEAAPAKTATTRRRRGGRGKPLSPELAAKITKVSDTEFNIERSMVDEILQNQAELMRSARIAPIKNGDKVSGVKLSGFGADTLLDHLGMKSGDVLLSINGFDMGDPQKALEAYGRLRQASNLKVQVERGGQPMTLEFNIQ